jgi:hypothetical protein
MADAHHEDMNVSRHPCGLSADRRHPDLLQFLRARRFVNLGVAPRRARELTGDIGSAGGGTGLFQTMPSLDQNEH